jgi:hypothetical protein
VTNDEMVIENNEEITNNQTLMTIIPHDLHSA